MQTEPILSLISWVGFFLSLISWVGFPTFPIGIWIRRVHFSILHTLLTNKVCQLHHHSKKKKNYTTIQNRVCLVGPSCWGAGWSDNWKGPLISSYSHLHVNNISAKIDFRINLLEDNRVPMFPPQGIFPLLHGHAGRQSLKAFWGESIYVLLFPRGKMCGQQRKS